VSAKDFLLRIFAERLLIGPLLRACRGKEMWRAHVKVPTVRDHNLWSSFHVNANGVGEVFELDGDNRSFEAGVEGNVSDDAAFLSCHDFVNWDLSILKPLDERDFSAVTNGDIEGVLSHLDVALRVEDDTLTELLDDGPIKVAVQERVFARVKHKDILSVEVDNFHLLSGHGSGLAKAEISDGTDLLNRGEVTDEHVVVLFHLKDTVGEGDSNGHGETLRDSNDKDDDRDDTVVNHLLRKNLSANIFVSAGLNDQNDSGGSKDGDGADETKETDAATNVIKLAGELSVLLLGVVGSILDTTGAMLSNLTDKSLAGTTDHKGIGEEEGRSEGVLLEVIPLERGVLIFFS